MPWGENQIFPTKYKKLNYCGLTGFFLIAKVSFPIERRTFI